MSREVRITIDDDEVFERMKHRKHELDLSWEEVLHRGLRRTPGGSDTSGTESASGSAGQYGSSGAGGPSGAASPGESAGPGGSSGQRGADHAGHGDRGSDTREQVERHHRRIREHREAARGARDGHDLYDDRYDDQWDRFADSVEAQVQNKVYNALRNTFGAAGIDVPEPPEPHMDREMQDLSNAEDAVLSFDFLDDDPAYQVPLRVNLQTSTGGLDVEVVAVRQGKNVRDMNRFDSAARLQVTKRLANGDPAILRFDDGAEGYEVEPVIRWERDEDGRPTVTAVDIEGVRLGEDDGE